MTTFVRRGLFAALPAALAVAALTAGGAEPAPRPRPVDPPQVLPDAAFRAILRDCNRFILEPFVRVRPWTGLPASVNHERVRANALLVALAAQNRLAAGGADAAKLATLRDAALKLAAVVEKNASDMPAILEHAAVLNRYPDVEPNPAASLDPVSIKSHFTHDDIVPLFTNCGLRTHLIERQIMLLDRVKTPFTPAQMQQLELLAFKAALIGDVLREMDDFVTVMHPSHKRDKERPDWVRFATEVRQTGWRLADSAGGGNPGVAKRHLSALNSACINCHNQFRE